MHYENPGKQGEIIRSVAAIMFTTRNVFFPKVLVVSPNMTVVFPKVVMTGCLR